jgi:polyhydroxyalkanoate synthesis regulator phasin
MLEDLQKLLGCGKPWAVKRASIANDLIEQYKSGELSEDEYKELLADLVATDKLNAEADDLNTKTMLIGCIKAAMKLV